MIENLYEGIIHGMSSYSESFLGGADSSFPPLSQSLRLTPHLVVAFLAGAIGIAIAQQGWRDKRH